MARRTLADYEAIIGQPPRADNTSSISDAIGSNIHKAEALTEWLVLSGIPTKSASQASAFTRARAYAIPNYLGGWRKNVNPSFAILADGLEALESFDFDSQSQSPSPGPSPGPTSPEPLPTSEPPPSPQHLKTMISAEVSTAVAKFMSTYKVEVELGPKEKAKVQEWTRSEAQLEAEAVALATITKLMPPRTITIANPLKGTTIPIGLQHKNFDKLLRACQTRDHKGHRLNIWLTGSTGSGKTSAAAAVAKALELPFGADSSLDADYKVFGYNNAQGQYVSTEFFRIFTGGGVYIADEIDAWHPSALVALNSALANGFANFPCGMKTRHPDCIIIACANTWGMGATNDYVGRSKLDAATLNRFQPKIEWPIDEDLESAIAQAQAGDLGIRWHDLVCKVRRAASTQGIKIIISPRDTINGIALLLQGFTWGETVEMTFGAGLSLDQRRSLQLGPELVSTFKVAHHQEAQEAKELAE